MALTFLHLADLHLDSPLKYLKKEKARQKRAEENQKTLQWIGKREVDLVLLCGDQFDNPHPSPQARHLLLEFLENFHHREIPVVMISGNHDMMGIPEGVYSDLSFLSPVLFLDNPNPTAPLELTIQNQRVYLYGLSYTPGKTDVEKANRLRRICPEGIHLALLHGSLQIRKDCDVDVHHLPLKPEDLSQSAMDYIALGHYHRKAIHQLGDVTCGYPGNPWGRGYRKSEMGPRYILEVTASEGKSPKVKAIPIGFPGSRLIEEERINLTALELSSPGELGKWIRKNCGGKERILKLILEGMAPFEDLNLRALEEGLRRDFFDIRIESNLDFIHTSSVQALRKENTIRGRCIQRILSMAEGEIDPEKQKVYELAVRYLLKHLK